MVKIGRIKGDKRHFAAEVAPAGNVLQWTEDETKAKPVTVEEARKVAEFYAGRRNAGRIIFGDEKGRQALAPVEGPVDKPVLPPVAVPDEVKNLKAANATMQKTVDSVRAEAKELRSINEKLRQENQDLDQRLTVADGLIKEHEESHKKFSEENAKLKADLAAAEKSVKDLQAKVKS
jgi:FtsZ-binding cell division protein ZapB